MDETRRKNAVEIVSILASAGGLVSLSEMLAQIPKDFPVPILYQQPVDRSRMHALRESIALQTDLHVVWLRDGCRLRPGFLYLCPGRSWVVVDKSIVSLIPLTVDSGAQSSVELAGSLIASYHGRCALVVLGAMEMTRGIGLLRRFEKSGVILSECGEYASPESLFGLALPLREIVPALAGLVSSPWAPARASGRKDRAARRAAAELRAFLNGLVALAVRIHGTAMGTVQLFDSAHAALHVGAQRGFDRDFLRSFWILAADDSSACGRAAKEMRTVVIEDIYADEAYAPYRAMATDAGYTSVQATPMITSAGKLIGIISTYFPKARHLTRTQLRIVQLYAAIAADVLERLTFHAGQGTTLAEGTGSR